jgi:hypothetical protein
MGKPIPAGFLCRARGNLVHHPCVPWRQPVKSIITIKLKDLHYDQSPKADTRKIDEHRIPFWGDKHACPIYRVHWTSANFFLSFSSPPVHARSPPSSSGDGGAWSPMSIMWRTSQPGGWLCGAGLDMRSQVNKMPVCWLWWRDHIAGMNYRTWLIPHFEQ